jgi:enoyl-CoA hydratase
MTTFHGLNVSIDGHVGELRLANAATLNAFDAALHHSFVAALRYLGTHIDVRAILLTAEGRLFSAGGSFDFIDELAGNPAQRREMPQDAHALFTTLCDIPVPVVAAMHGDAIGLGATIVTACDAVVAHPQARLIDPHVRVGLCAGDGGVASWTLAAGLMRAKRHLLTGDPLSAREAHAIGLVTDLVDSVEEVVPAARKLAQRIAELPPLAVRGTKAAFNTLARDNARAAFEVSLLGELACLASADVLEAVKAAREKRKGHYRGI